MVQQAHLTLRFQSPLLPLPKMELGSDFVVAMFCDESMMFLVQLQSSVDGISILQRLLKSISLLQDS
jgi:hypothetical protein